MPEYCDGMEVARHAALNSVAPMRVIIISPVVPWHGVDHAGGVYLHAWIKALSIRGHSVHVVAPHTDANVYAAHLSHGLEIHLVDNPPLPTGWRGALRYAWIRGVGLSPGPGLIRRIRRDPVVRNLVKDADIVELQWSEFLPLSRWLNRHRSSDSTSVFVAHDRLSLTLLQRAVEGDGLINRVLACVALIQAVIREPRLARRNDVVVTFNPEDVRYWQRTGARNVAVMPAVIWSQAEAPPPSSAPQRCIFVAAFHRRENVEAARWLVRHVWPAVVSQVPSARLVLAGSDPEGDALALAGASVEATGYLEDLSQTYLGARVALAPGTRGAGLKFKVPQAMAFGRPVVASTNSARGIAALGGRSGFAAVTDDPVEFAKAICRMLEDPGAADHIGRCGRDFVRAEYNFESAVDHLLHTTVRP